MKRLTNNDWGAGSGGALTSDWGGNGLEDWGGNSGIWGAGGGGIQK